MKAGDIFIRVNKEECYAYYYLNVTGDNFISLVAPINDKPLPISYFNGQQLEIVGSITDAWFVKRLGPWLYMHVKLQRFYWEKLRSLLGNFQIRLAITTGVKAYVKATVLPLPSSQQAGWVAMRYYGSLSEYEVAQDKKMAL